MASACSLGVPYGGLGISKLQVLNKKRKEKQCLQYFFQFLVIKTLDPNPDPLTMLDSDPLEMMDSDPLEMWIRIRIQ